MIMIIMCLLKFNEYIYSVLFVGSCCMLPILIVLYCPEDAWHGKTRMFFDGR